MSGIGFRKEMENIYPSLYIIYRGVYTKNVERIKPVDENQTVCVQVPHKIISYSITCILENVTSLLNSFDPKALG